MIEDMGPEEADRLDNLDEFISNVVEYQNNTDTPSLVEFLEETALVADVDRYDDTADAVVLMTIHSAKGLEFPQVFLPGFEEGIFPGPQSASDPEEVEEERRLSYVAITRAKECLFCIHVRERLMFGRTQYNPVSRFVTEIDEDDIETESMNAPVHQRSQPARSKRYAISKEFFTQPAVKSAKPSNAFEHFSVGERVSHMAFGLGTVLSAKEMGTDVLYEIAFDEVGTKKLMATFAKLKRGE